MTVEELIEVLKTFDSSLTVVSPSGYANAFSENVRVDYIKAGWNSNTPTVHNASLCKENEASHVAIYWPGI